MLELLSGRASSTSASLAVLLVAEVVLAKKRCTRCAATRLSHGGLLTKNIREAAAASLSYVAVAIAATKPDSYAFSRETAPSTELYPCWLDHTATSSSTLSKRSP